MHDLLDGFNFITAQRSGRSGAGDFTGISVITSSRGSNRKSITFKLSKHLMKKAGIVVGDRVNIGFKFDGEKRFIFICRSPDGSYSVSAPAQYRGKHVNASVKMAATPDIERLSGFVCDISDIEFLRSGGFIANE